MSLSKQNYEKVAEVIKDRNQAVKTYPLEQRVDLKHELDLIEGRLANYFAEDNPDFDRDKFHKACEVDNVD